MSYPDPISNSEVGKLIHDMSRFVTKTYGLEVEIEGNYFVFTYKDIEPIALSINKNNGEIINKDNKKLLREFLEEECEISVKDLKFQRLISELNNFYMNKDKPRQEVEEVVEDKPIDIDQKDAKALLEEIQETNLYEWLTKVIEPIFIGDPKNIVGKIVDCAGAIIHDTKCFVLTPGESGSGKSWEDELVVMHMMPKESVIPAGHITPAYLRRCDHLDHKLLYIGDMGNFNKLKDEENMFQIIKGLVSEGRAGHAIVEKEGENWNTEESFIEVEGFVVVAEGVKSYIDDKQYEGRSVKYYVEPPSSMEIAAQIDVANAIEDEEPATVEAFDQIHRLQNYIRWLKSQEMDKPDISLLNAEKSEFIKYQKEQTVRKFKILCKKGRVWCMLNNKPSFDEEDLALFKEFGWFRKTPLSRHEEIVYNKIIGDYDPGALVNDLGNIISGEITNDMEGWSTVEILNSVVRSESYTTVEGLCRSLPQHFPNKYFTIGALKRGALRDLSEIDKDDYQGLIDELVRKGYLDVLPETNIQNNEIYFVVE